ncbi:uncharacterized protein LOC108034079 isoform X2 [Drosophila biarmipes]|uniref:uncharacterized protein LOC108034079 isoform X2 n=1 Tax=Drosophila biarmipes TaxID=125945 RepID=UPI0007E7FCDF|nr:uncharacterized protein LOC108034079 isoform X2 [Drosophila biarmipes]
MNCSDLRKLIKYEERLAENAKEDHFSGLHKRGTVSSRAKLSVGEKDKENAAPPACPCPSAKEKESKTDQDDDRQERSGGGEGFADLARLFKEKLLMDASVPPTASNVLEPGKRRSRSKTRQGKEPPLSSGESEADKDRPRMQRRRRSKSHPRSVSRGRSLARGRCKSKHCDPVALFQYYQKEWAHFRSQIPGENSRASARYGAHHKPMVPRK